MEKIKLKIVGMSFSQSRNGAYALILGEEDGKRRLPIIIGGFEAQAIAIELEKMKPARPLTHDLFKSFASQFAVDVREVVINKFYEGVFHARLVCQQGDDVTEIDSRTSDAVAIALRFHCPIYTYENIMSAAGIVMDDDQATDDIQAANDPENEFSSLSIDELKEMLKEAVEKEDFERASLIRDEINSRK